VDDPGPGELTIRVLACGVNPADAKHVAAPRAGVEPPVPIGYEVSGVVIAVGADAVSVTGPVAVGDEVVAFRVQGGFATHITVPAQKVLRKPATLTHAEAANLLLAGSTAAEMLHVTEAVREEVVLLHGASGAVGVSVLQQAALRGIRVIGTTSARRAEVVRSFGGLPVEYGEGLARRVKRVMSENGIASVDAALDAAGTQEAVDVSLALVPDRARIVTIAAPAAAAAHGFRALAGAHPDSARFRDEVRVRLVEAAERGELRVPVVREYPLAEAPAALAFVAEGHPGGKVALIPGG